MPNPDMTEQNRTVYFDFLRVTAILAAMIVHIVDDKWQSIDIYSYEWNVLNLYNSIGYWGIGTFAMISGALFLRRDIAVTKIYGKYIFRIATAFLFWSFLYALGDFIENGNVIHALQHFINGNYHMWFLFMITGLYMLIPFLKKIVASDFLTKYFLVLSLIFTFIIPETKNIIMLFSEEWGLFAEKYIEGFKMHFVLGFTGYFILGYFLDNIAISKRAERIIYALGILGYMAQL